MPLIRQARARLQLCKREEYPRDYSTLYIQALAANSLSLTHSSNAKKKKSVILRVQLSIIIVELQWKASQIHNLYIKCSLELAQIYRQIYLFSFYSI